jgi:hypothetical protein
VENKLWDPLEVILCGPPEEQHPSKKAGQNASTDAPQSPLKSIGVDGDLDSSFADPVQADPRAAAVLAPALPQRTALPAEIVTPLVERCYASGEAKAISIGIRAVEMHRLSSRLFDEVCGLRLSSSPSSF